jgi:hypothetical protein
LISHQFLSPSSPSRRQGLKLRLTVSVSVSATFFIRMDLARV